MLNNEFLIKDSYTYDDLILLLEFLNSEDGCDWDIVQTHDSIKDNLIEEAYEVAQEIDNNDNVALLDELGDYLLQPLFHGIIAKRNNSFCIEDIITHLVKKIIKRHPHVFINKQKLTRNEALASWQSQKEKTVYQSLCTLPSNLPIEYKLKKIKKALLNKSIGCSDLDNELQEQLEQYNHNLIKINDILKQMIELTK